MAEKKNEQPQIGEQANVGRRERSTVGTADQRIDASKRAADEMKHEVAQRSFTPATKDGAKSEETAEDERDAAPAAPQTSGYGQREDRENPAAGINAHQSGAKQSQELPSQGGRNVPDARSPGAQKEKMGRAMSQNGARVSDFEEMRDSTPSRV